ncbi:hypothetical protein D3C72_1120050 [compost metagenome]
MGLAHVGAVEQGFDVQQDQHAVVVGADAGDEAGIHGCTEFRGRADLLGRQRDHVGDAVDHDADHAVFHVEHDHHGEGVVAGILQAQLQAQVDHRHDGAAQVDDTLDVIRRIGDAGDGVVTADLLHLEDVHAIVLGTEGEAEEFAIGAGGGAVLVVHRGVLVLPEVPVSGSISAPWWGTLGIHPRMAWIYQGWVVPAAGRQIPLWGCQSSPLRRALRWRSMRKM